MNCFTYAMSVWRISRPDNGLLIRASHWGKFPHFSVIFELADGSLMKCEYVPTEPKHKWFPPLFFKGEVRKTYYRLEAQ